MRIYSTVQLCSITSLWHSGQRLCRAIGRLQVRISLGFWLFSKRRSLSSWLLWKKTSLAGLQCTLSSSCAIIGRQIENELETDFQILTWKWIEDKSSRAATFSGQWAYSCMQWRSALSYSPRWYSAWANSTNDEISKFGIIAELEDTEDRLDPLCKLPLTVAAPEFVLMAAAISSSGLNFIISIYNRLSGTYEVNKNNVKRGNHNTWLVKTASSVSIWVIGLL